MSDNRGMSLVEKRFDTQEIAHIEVYGRYHGKMIARLLNLSKSGAFFEMSQSEYVPKTGDMICVTVHLPAIKRSHIIHAQVIWGRGLGFGTQFITRQEVMNKLLVK